MEMLNADAKEFIENHWPFKVNNMFAKQVGRMYIVYSYGEHWPLAVWTDGTGWMVNVEKVSRTTDRHYHIVASAVHECQVMPKDELLSFIKENDHD